MLAKITPFLARLGVDASDLTLMIFGGAGGVHGPILADEVGIRRIIVPRLPSVFCAFGGLVSDLVHDAVRSVNGLTLDPAQLTRSYAALVEEGKIWLARQSHDGQVMDVDHLLLADMRYAAQSFTIPVELSSHIEGDMAGVFGAFHTEHNRLFGHSTPAAPVAIDTLRVRTSGRQAKPVAVPLVSEQGPAARPTEHRRLRFGRKWIEDVPVFDWTELSPGWTILGPCIIQQDLATVLVPPSYEARVGVLGDLELSRG
jgi:N-methylhydantoinase A